MCAVRVSCELDVFFRVCVLSLCVVLCFYVAAMFCCCCCCCCCCCGGGRSEGRRVGKECRTGWSAYN